MSMWLPWFVEIMLCEKKRKLTEISEEEKAVSSTSIIIRKEILKMKDSIPWPLSEQDLTPNKIIIGKLLGKFLNILSGSETMYK